MDEPFLPPKRTSKQQLPPEFLMPVPFFELVCDKLYCVCNACLCCFTSQPWD